MIASLRPYRLGATVLATVLVSASAGSLAAESEPL